MKFSSVTARGGELTILRSEFQKSIRDELTEGRYVSGTLFKFNGKWITYSACSTSSQPETTEATELRIFIDRIKENGEKSVAEHDGHRIFYADKLEELLKLIGITMEESREYNPKLRADAENYVLMLSRYEPPIILPDIARFFNDPQNPFFIDKDYYDEEGGENLFMAQRVGDDLAEYIQDNHIFSNCGIYMSQGKEAGRKLLNNNYRFLAGFYRTLVPK